MNIEIIKTCLISLGLAGFWLFAFHLGLLRAKRLWLISVALISAVNFSFFSGEAASRIAIADLLFLTLSLCLWMRGVIHPDSSMSFPVKPLGIFGLFFLTLILSYQAPAWENRILLGEVQFTTFIITSTIFFTSVYFMKGKQDLLFCLRAWSVAALITVIIAFSGLYRIFQSYQQPVLFDNDGFFGIRDVVSGELVKRAALSEYGFRITGSFRTIGQLASFSLTSFFAMSAASFFPDISNKERWFYRFLAVSLIVSAVFTTRSSIYPSLALGVILLTSLYFKNLKTACKIAMVAGAALIVVIITVSRFKFTEIYQQLVDRNVWQITNLFHGKGFFAEQFHRVVDIFKDHPWFGIGYGRFLNSPYHEFVRGFEIHSTLFQLLAETGLFGVTAYLILMGYFLIVGIKMIRLTWDSEWRKTSFVLLLGYVCMQPSYLYNRHLRERTFWLFIAIIYSLWRFYNQRKMTQPLCCKDREKLTV